MVLLLPVVFMFRPMELLQADNTNVDIPPWNMFFNTFRQRHNGHHFADDIYELIFLL